MVAKIAFIDNLFSLCLESDPNDTHSWYQYADFLDKVAGNATKAMVHFFCTKVTHQECSLRALLADITHFEAGALYMILLHSHGTEQELQEFSQFWDAYLKNRWSLGDAKVTNR